MPSFKLACRYGLDGDPGLGVVEQIYPVDRDHAAILTGHDDCVVVPYEGELRDIAAWPKYGPEPQLLGDPPTAVPPSHADLDKHDVPLTIVDPVLGEIQHPLREMADKGVYPDNRVFEDDHRPPQAPRDWTPDMLLAYAAQERWVKEIGGVTVGNFPAYTTREAVPVYAAAASRAARDPKFSKRMTGTDGKAYDLNAAKLIAVSDGVADHVQACFDAEDAIKASIAKGAVKTYQDVDKGFASL